MREFSSIKEAQAAISRLELGEIVLVCGRYARVDAVDGRRAVRFLSAVQMAAFQAREWAEERRRFRPTVKHGRRAWAAK